jgi:hypothetical protein
MLPAAEKWVGTGLFTTGMGVADRKALLTRVFLKIRMKTERPPE